MGLVRRTSSGGYALLESSSDDDHVATPNAPPEREPMVTVATPVASSDTESSFTEFTSV